MIKVRINKHIDGHPYKKDDVIEVLEIRGSYAMTENGGFLHIGDLEHVDSVEEDICTVDALRAQVGGSHYKDCAMQPIEFIEANSLGFLEGSIVKRATRHNKPTGKGAEDIKKLIHEAQLILKLRYKA